MSKATNRLFQRSKPHEIQSFLDEVFIGYLESKEPYEINKDELHNVYDALIEFLNAESRRVK